MSSLLDSLSSFSSGSSVSDYTGKSMDGVVAGVYSTVVQQMTGLEPVIVKNPDKSVTMILNEDQAKMMRKFLDKQLWSVLKKPAGQSLHIDLNPVIVPWVLKYALPAAAVLVALGWFGRGWMQR